MPREGRGGERRGLKRRACRWVNKKRKARQCRKMRERQKQRGGVGREVWCGDKKSAPFCGTVCRRVACVPSERIGAYRACTRSRVAGGRAKERLREYYCSPLRLFYSSRHTCCHACPLLPGVRAKITCVTAGCAAEILTARPCE